MARRSRKPETVPYERAFYFGFSGMVLLVCLSILTEAVAVAYYIKLLLFQAALVVLCVVWILRQRATGRFGLLPSPFNLPVLLYLAATAFSIFQAVNRVEALVQISHQVALTFLFLILLNNVRGPDFLRYLRPIAVAGALIGAVGILQYLGLGFLWIPSAGMPSATLGYRNFAAMGTVVCIPIALLLFLESRGLGEVRTWGIACAAMVLFLTYTRTRGAWIGLGVACVVFGAAALILKWRGRMPQMERPFGWRERIGVVTAGALSVVVLSFLPPRMGQIGLERQRPEKLGIAQTMASVLTPRGDKDRLTLWKHTLEMIGDHPLLGVGAGNWQFAYPAYDGGEIITSTTTPRRPHNDYLWVFSELGLPGILILLWILGLALIRAVRTAAGAASPFQFRAPLLLGMAVLAIMGDALFSFPKERIAPSMLFWVALALIAVLDMERRPAVQVKHSRAWKALLMGSAALLVLCLWTAARGLVFDRHHARALAYAEQNRWDGTVREATDALRFGAFDPQIFLLRGLARYTQGRYGGAVEDNLSCLAYHPDFPNALNNLGMAYNGRRAFDKALGALQRLLEIDPDRAETHANMGVAYQGLGRNDEAVAEFKRALARDPDRIEFRYYLGAAYEEQGYLDRAIDEYSQVLGRNTQNAAAHYRLGSAYRKKGSLDRAVHELRQALLIDPAYLPAHFGLAEAYTLQGDTARAIESYRAFLKNWRGDPRAAQNAKERLKALKEE